MKILVTGGAGFLGQALVRRLLLRGDEVRFFSRSDAPSLVEAGAEAVLGDVRDAEAVRGAVKGCEAVVHCAALIGDGGRFEDYFRTNVEGTQHVIDACRAHGVPKLVFTSSYAVVHGGEDLEGVDERQPYPKKFLAPYPHTKALAEQRVLAANDRALATVALRPHLVWGPGDTQLLPRAVARALAGALRFPRGPQKLIDSTYIDDAVNAHLLAVDRVAPGAVCAGRAFFITQGSPLPMTEFVSRVLAAVGVAPPPSGRLTPRMLYFVGQLVDAAYSVPGLRTREPPLTRFLARQATTAHWFDIGAARRDLDYEPTVSIDEGLRRLSADHCLASL
jgi:nucleoside-diphosphate-sugar epimerase